MKHFYSTILILFLSISALNAHTINQQQLTDSLRAYASRHAILEARVRIKNIRQSSGVLRIETNPSLACLAYTPEMTRELKQIVRKVARVKASTRIDIYSDGYEIEQLIGNHYLPSAKRRAPYTIVDKEKPMIRNLSLPYTIESGLQNKYIALWASHGRFFDQKENRWRWQRANVLETVEDLLTSSFTMPFLVPMLENAGAMVIQPRERDTQTNEVVMEGRDAVGDGSIAWFLPTIPQAGRYAVYAWWEQGKNKSDEVTYTIMHGGYETTLKVNQHMSGHTWVYLGTYYFHSGADEANGVRIEGLGGQGKERLLQCRMKFGGGMGSIPRSADSTIVGETSGVPRWMEGSRYWLEYAGIPDSVYLFSEGKNDYTDDFASRGRWLNYLCGGSPAHPDSIGLNIPINVGIAFHTDAGTYLGDTTVGTLVIYTDHNNDKKRTLPTGDSRLTIRDYAERIQTQVINDIRTVYAPEWSRRELRNSSYSETRNPEVPTIILELLSHQNIADMRYGHDPRFKFLVSRAVYKGILKYLADQYRFDYTVQPLPVSDFGIRRTADDEVMLSWQPTIDTLEPTAKPTYYIVYQQVGNGEWSQGIKTTDTFISLPINKGRHMSYRVAAGNSGGISLCSETLSAYIHPQQKGMALIVNSFTRVSAPEYVYYQDGLDGFYPNTYGIAYGKDISFTGKQYEFHRNLKWVSDEDPGYGACLQDYYNTLEVGNTFDYPLVHGRAIAKAGYSYISQSVGYVCSHSIDSTFSFVDLIMGKQKESTLGTEKRLTDYKTFTPELQRVITRYLNTCGNLLVSGAYIGSDMSNNNADRSFIRKTLHYQLQTSSCTRQGNVQTAAAPKTTVQYYTLPNERCIPAEMTDALSPYGNDARTILYYTDSGQSAATAYLGDYKCVAVGFPIECIKSEKQIEQLMKHIISFLCY